MQIKTMLWYHVSMIRLAKIQKLDSALLGREGGETVLPHSAGGNASWCNLDGGEVGNTSQENAVFNF